MSASLIRATLARPPHVIASGISSRYESIAIRISMGKHSIRINDQWRIVFRWTDAGPEDVEIIDYH